MVKKAILITVIIIAMLSVTACRQNRNRRQNQDGKINITTTIFPAYDFVRQIAGNRVNLTLLLSPGAESHSFEPSPRDVIAIYNSDIFIFVGGHSEMWIERVLQSMNTENLRLLAMMDTVDVVEEELAEGMEQHFCDEDDPDHRCDDVEYDEHVWTSPLNAVLIVRAITELLGETDPANAYFYRENAAAYIKELEELDAAFTEVVAGGVRETVVFGDRFPFRYFVDEYGLTYSAAFAGCSADTDPSAATVAFLINKIREEQIPVVFYIELSSERVAGTISSETGAKKLLFHSAHNVTRRDYEAGLGYVDLMRRNVDTLREALH